MKDSGIYRIRNIINNKIYIGSASKFIDRKYLHFSLLRKNKHHSIVLQRAYNKYGKDKFIFEIIEKCDKNLLLEKEQYYIDTLKPEYNSCKIAGRTDGLISKKRIPIIQYDFNGNIIRHWNCLEDIRKSFNLSNSSKISQCCKLKRKSVYGYVWRYSEDKTKFQYNKQRKGKCIALIDEENNIIKIWKTLKECSIYYNVYPSQISAVYSKSTKIRTKTMKGKLFRIVNKEEMKKYRYLIENNEKLNYGS